VGFMFLPC